MGIRFKIWIYACAIVLLRISSSQASSVKAKDISCELRLLVEEHFSLQADIAIQRLRENINPGNTEPGVIVASPSRHSPNYFYDWVRDSALVWKTLLKIWDSGRFPEFRAEIPLLARDFVRAQMTMQDNGEGEPKHNVDHTPFEEEWGRPQNDGPGLRMQVMTDLLNRELLDETSVELALQIIEQDRIYLDEAIHHPDIEPWEEVQGFHFYNRMQIAKGAFDAAQLFSENGRFAGRYDSKLYFRLHAFVLNMLRDHFNFTNFIKPTYRTGRLASKYTDLDITVLLAHLHAEFPSWWDVDIENHRLLGSVVTLLQHFDEIYPINKQGYPGTMAGRYPEDIYDGITFEGGNPWFLSTLAVAEYFHRLAKHWNYVDRILITPEDLPHLRYVFNRYHPNMELHTGEFHRGNSTFHLLIDAFERFSSDQMKRTLVHIGDDGSMAEQSSRFDGHMRGASHLSWSYGAYLRTYIERVH